MLSVIFLLIGVLLLAKLLVWAIGAPSRAISSVAQAVNARTDLKALENQGSRAATNDFIVSQTCGTCGRVNQCTIIVCPKCKTRIGRLICGTCGK